LTIQEFAGARVPLINDAFAIMLIVGLATLVRYGGETLATHVRLREMVLAQGQPPGAQRESFRIISAILGAGVFLFCAVPYVGWAWPLWIAGGVTLARTLVVGFQHYLPASRFKHLAPRGLLNFLVMIGVGILLTHLLRDHIHSSHQLVVISTVVIVLPGLLFELARAVTRNREEIPMTWAIRAAGAFAVAATVVLCVATGLVFT